MSSSFVDFREKGFWINDSLLSLVTSYLYHDLNREEGFKSFDLEMLNDLKLCACGYNSGFLSLDFDKHFVVSKNRELFIQFLEDFINETSQKSEVITPDELNIIQMDIEFNGKWTEGLERSKILNVCLFMKKLLEGKLNITVKDNINYFF